MNKVYITYWVKESNGQHGIGTAYTTKELAMQAVQMLRDNRDNGDPDVQGYEWYWDDSELMDYVPELSKQEN